jgi:hypothetical protein
MPTLQEIIVTILGLLALYGINYGVEGLRSLKEQEEQKG